MTTKTKKAATAGLTDEQIANLRLSSGAHQSPDAGHCLLEVVSLFAGENFSDSPTCVDPVLAAFGRTWNDGMRDDAERDQLKRYIPLLPGTAQGKALSEQRAWMAGDWLIRSCLPAWFDLTPALAEHAAQLRALAPITDPRGLVPVRSALDCAARIAVAARVAARAAARVAARVAAWDTAWDTALDTARVAARAAARDAARAAAMAAARDAALDTARVAAWDAAWDTARVAEVNKYDAAYAAARAVLAPTTERLQAEAHDLYLRMIQVGTDGAEATGAQA